MSDFQSTYNAQLFIYRAIVEHLDSLQYVLIKKQCFCDTLLLRDEGNKPESQGTEH